MNTCRLRITDLVSHTVTRSRGLMAYKALKPYLGNYDNIEISVSSEDRPLSLSFLDELIVRLANASELDRTTFVVNESGTLDKLSRVGEIRQLKFNYIGDGTDQKKHVPWIGATRSKVTSVGTKPVSEAKA